MAILIRSFLASGALCASLFALAWLPAQAQTVYRIVGPDGKVSFSDKPPADATQRAAPAGRAAGAGASDGPSLPFELRQVATRYPVTLYTGLACAPCDNGRNLLATRGVPFTERTVKTPEDGEALGRLMGGMTLPMLTIGAQQVRGFSATEWTQYLDAAGYPKTSALPAGYRRGDATPLAPVVQEAAARPAAAPNQPAAAPQGQPPAPPAADRPNPANPAGIRF